MSEKDVKHRRKRNVYEVVYPAQDEAHSLRYAQEVGSSNHDSLTGSKTGGEQRIPADIDEPGPVSRRAMSPGKKRSESGYREDVGSN